MAFSFYQSLRTVPRDLDEVARGFRLTGWQKFWQLEAPFAVPGLIWNTMMSMSGGWFFVVASEAITVGDTTITLPGVGSYIATANAAGNWSAVFAAVVTMGIVILAYDQLLFRPSSPGRANSASNCRSSQEVRNVLGARTAAAHQLDPPRGFRPVFAALRSVSLLADRIAETPSRPRRRALFRDIALARRRLDRADRRRSPSRRSGASSPLSRRN